MMYASIFARQNRYAPPLEFPLASSKRPVLDLCDQMVTRQ